MNLREWNGPSALLGGVLVALVVSACSLLPDRVYTEVANNPWDPRLTETDEYVVSFGVEYDLSPQEVVIAGQQERHPWDAGAALGLWEGQDAMGPVPLVVEDTDTKQVLEELHLAIVAQTQTMAQLAADARAMREAFDRAESSWDSVNRTLLGGGGLGSLILLLAGGRVLARKRQAHTNSEA